MSAFKKKKFIFFGSVILAIIIGISTLGTIYRYDTMKIKGDLMPFYGDSFNIGSLTNPWDTFFVNVMVSVLDSSAIGNSAVTSWHIKDSTIQMVDLHSSTIDSLTPDSMTWTGDDTLRHYEGATLTKVEILKVDTAEYAYSAAGTTSVDTAKWAKDFPFSVGWGLNWVDADDSVYTDTVEFNARYVLIPADSEDIDENAVSGWHINNGTILAEDIYPDIVSSVEGVANDGGNIDLYPDWGIGITANSPGAGSIAIAISKAVTDAEYVNVGEIPTGDLSGTYPNPSVDYSDSTGAIAESDMTDKLDDNYAELYGVGSDSTYWSLHSDSSDYATTSGGAPPTGSAGGDLTGTYPNPGIASGVIVNDDVNSSAAIAGTKIDPDFGNQTIQTSGYLDVGGASWGAGIDCYNGNFALFPLSATAGNPLRDSPYLYLISRYWTGAASADRNASIYHNVINATPTSEILFRIAGATKAAIKDDGNFEAVTLESTVSTGTIPVQVVSTTKCDNLNADKVDGYNCPEDIVPFDSVGQGLPIPRANGFMMTDLNADKVDGFDAADFGKLDTLAPPVPTGLDLTTGTIEGVANIAWVRGVWNSMADAGGPDTSGTVGYAVYLHSGSYIADFKSRDTVAIFEGLESGLKCSVKVASEDGSGNISAYCTEDTITTAEDETAPATPTLGIPVQNPMDDTWYTDITLFWSSNDEKDFDSYTLQYYFVSWPGEMMARSDLKDTVFTVLGAHCQDSLVWRVAARDVWNNISSFNEDTVTSITCETIPPDTPNSITVRHKFGKTYLSCTQVDAPDLAGYQWLQSSDHGASYSELGATENNHYQPLYVGYFDDSIYYYSVSAFDMRGNYSDTIAPDSITFSTDLDTTDFKPWLDSVAVSVRTGVNYDGTIKNNKVVTASINDGAVLSEKIEDTLTSKVVDTTCTVQEKSLPLIYERKYKYTASSPASGPGNIEIESTLPMIELQETDEDSLRYLMYVSGGYWIWMANPDGQGNYFKMDSTANLIVGGGAKITAGNDTIDANGISSANKLDGNNLAEVKRINKGNSFPGSAEVGDIFVKYNDGDKDSVFIYLYNATWQFLLEGPDTRPSGG